MCQVLYEATYKNKQSGYKRFGTSVKNTVMSHLS